MNLCAVNRLIQYPLYRPVRTVMIDLYVWVTVSSNISFPLIASIHTRALKHSRSVPSVLLLAADSIHSQSAKSLRTESSISWNAAHCAVCSCERT